MNAPAASASPSSTPARPGGPAQPRAVGDAVDAMPPRDAREAFAHALSRLQRLQRCQPESEREPSPSPMDVAMPRAPRDAQPGEDSGLAARVVPAAAPPANLVPSAPEATGLQARLSPDELHATLASLRAPASEQGPQQWQFRFGQAHLPVMGVTLTGLPGSGVQLQLHAGVQRPLRERELATQRLADLRQRLGERGAVVSSLGWGDDPLGHADAEPGGAR